jgi:hypothetical protein
VNGDQKDDQGEAKADQGDPNDELRHCYPVAFGNPDFWDASQALLVSCSSSKSD